jgi:hypothetical protein
VSASEFGLLPGLRGLRGADHRVPVRLGLGDDGVALDLGDARFAQRVQVALAVADVANGEADDAQAHVGHVAGGHFLHLGGEGVAVLVNILHGHGAENGAQMAFQRLRGDVLDFVNGLAEDLLGGGGDGNVVALDLDLRHAVHFHRHAFAGIDLRRLHINGQQFEREPVHLFKTGMTKVPPPLTMRKPRIRTCRPARHICVSGRKRRAPGWGRPWCSGWPRWHS